MKTGQELGYFGFRTNDCKKNSFGTEHCQINLLTDSGTEDGTGTQIRPMVRTVIGTEIEPGILPRMENVIGTKNWNGCWV